MNAMLNELHESISVAETPNASDDVRREVLAVLNSMQPRTKLGDRRRERRYPYPYLVHLTPVGADGIKPQGETVVVVGKQISERGFDFYHPTPLPYRRMIVSLETACGMRTSLLIDLTWCRFTRHGWYESGGRFLRAIERE